MPNGYTVRCDARLEFTADIDGKFEIEAHSHTAGDIPLAELTVQPG